MYHKIPKNLEEALLFLNQRDIEDVDIWRDRDEKEAVIFAHFGLGANIRYEWRLWFEDSDYLQYFVNKGVSWPDDITSITLTAWHRQLNGIEVNEEELINQYKSEEE